MHPDRRHLNTIGRQSMIIAMASLAIAFLAVPIPAHAAGLPEGVTIEVLAEYSSKTPGVERPYFARVPRIPGPPGLSPCRRKVCAKAPRGSWKRLSARVARPLFTRSATGGTLLLPQGEAHQPGHGRRRASVLHVGRKRIAASVSVIMELFGRTPEAGARSFLTLEHYPILGGNPSGRGRESGYPAPPAINLDPRGRQESSRSWSRCAAACVRSDR